MRDMHGVLSATGRVFRGSNFTLPSERRIDILHKILLNFLYICYVTGVTAISRSSTGIESYKIGTILWNQWKDFSRAKSI